jgi:predicted kinase
MPVLIHLNGPSGVGKSTLAQRYVDDHPGVLNLDIDTVVSLIGGWRENFFGALAPARQIAIAMAEAHLRNGRDVVMPQLVTRVDEAERFEAAAGRARAEYVEIALTVEPVEQIRRFRAKANHSDLHAHIERAVTAEGGDDLLHRIHRHFGTYIAQRPAALHLNTSGADVSESYSRVLAVLNGGST